MTESAFEDQVEFDLLSPPLQKWVCEKRWPSFRSVQKLAIRRLLEKKCRQDLLLAAPTAGGKTMAAFLPLLTLLTTETEAGEEGQTAEIAPGYGLLYVIPTRALISQQSAPENDLVRAAATVGVERTPWMSDVDGRIKQESWARPQGVLLITPESLERRLLDVPFDIESRFRSLRAVVIDELHAFFESPRGPQLISQLTRIENVLGRPIQRIALSATLGDGSRESRDSIHRFLRPGREPPEVERAEVPSSDMGEQVFDIHLKVRLDDQGGVKTGHEEIVEDLRQIYDRSQAKGGLIFANSRREVDTYAYLLNCKDNQVELPDDWEEQRPRAGGASMEGAPKRIGAAGGRKAGKQGGSWQPFVSEDPWTDPRRYWPHHGSLDRKIRSQGELRMRTKNVDCTLVATTTLELGIDVGTVKEVAQLGPGYSVASLRQRMGRSGRPVRNPDPKPGEKVWITPPARLHVFVREPRDGDHLSAVDRLHLPTFQALAQIDLLRRGIFEAPDLEELHLSTFVQQLLSLVHQHREQGITRQEVEKVLVVDGPFQRLREPLVSGRDQSIFDAVINRLSTGVRPLLDQDRDRRGEPTPDSELFLTRRGEQRVGSRDFQTAFWAPREYVLRSPAGTLGTAALGTNYGTGDRILFFGRAWEITAIDHRGRVIQLRHASSGKALHFTGEGRAPSDQVVGAMRKLFERDPSVADPKTICDLDPLALEIIEEGQSTYGRLGLIHGCQTRLGQDILWFPWAGTKTLNGLVSVLRWHGVAASVFHMAILLQDRSLEELREVVSKILDSPLPSEEDLARRYGSVTLGKFDRLLTPSLRRRNYRSSRLGSKEVIQSKLCHLKESLS